MCEKTEFWNDLKSGKFASMVRESTKGKKITNAEEVYNTVKPLFANQDDIESFYCIFLNAKNNMLAIEKMFSGSISNASVYPREIVKRVIALKSTSVVLIHNHPSGDPEPSRTDISITVRIGIVLDSIGVCIHDHIIVGDDYYTPVRQLWDHFWQISLKSVMISAKIWCSTPKSVGTRIDIYSLTY